MCQLATCVPASRSSTLFSADIGKSVDSYNVVFHSDFLLLLLPLPLLLIPQMPKSSSQLISLPPLDYLQQHRRGSLTDPSLHASRLPDGTPPFPPYPPQNSHTFSTTPRRKLRLWRHRILLSPPRAFQQTNPQNSPLTLPGSRPRSPQVHTQIKWYLQYVPLLAPARHAYLFSQETSLATQCMSTMTLTPPVPVFVNTTTATTALVATPSQ